MQGGDGGPQGGDCFAQSSVEAVEALRVRIVAQIIEIQPRCEEILQRSVVELLGEFAVLALLGAHGFGDQPAPNIEKELNSSSATRQSERQCGDGHRQPEQAADLHVDHMGDVAHRLVAVGIDDPGEQVSH